MRNMRPYLFTAALILGGRVLGQAPEMPSSEQVAVTVEAGIAHARTEGRFARFIAEANPSGSLTCDITVDHRGTTKTVFVVSDALADPAHATRLKDLLMELRYELRMPKGKRRKVRTTVTFP